jgi:hypothetical protein
MVGFYKGRLVPWVFESLLLSQDGLLSAQLFWLKLSPRNLFFIYILLKPQRFENVLFPSSGE